MSAAKQLIDNAATWLLALFVAACVVGWSSVASADQVELEVILLPGAPPSAAHDWMRSLEKAEVDRLRLRHSARVTQPSIETDSRAGETVYSIQAVVTDNRLVVPGDRFSRFEVGRLNDWLASIATHADGGGSVHAFGMSAEQLVHVHKSLSQPISGEVKGESVKRLLHALASDLPIKLSSRVRLSNDQVREELTGLSSGTALAAILRPLGLVLVPVRTGTHRTDVALEIRRFQDAKETWPVGWPRKEGIKQLAPKMLDFLEVEISDTPLDEALDRAAEPAGTAIFIRPKRNGSSRYRS